PGYWGSFAAAFFGVFAFQGVLRNMNVTIFNKGVMTIQDWIAKASDSAVAAAIAKQARLDLARQRAIVERLMEMPIEEVNTYVLQLLGSNTGAALDEAARREHADKKLYKALELASKVPDQLDAIARGRTPL